LGSLLLEYKINFCDGINKRGKDNSFGKKTGFKVEINTLV